MDSEDAHQKDNDGDKLPITEEQGDASQNSQSQQKPQRTPAFANQLPPSVSQQRLKPKRSTNALHLLFLESCKMYVMKDMSLKDEADITKLLKDKRKIWSELKAYCSQQILQTAKTLIQHELTEQGKEALADVSPDNEIINMRFDEYEAVERSFDDAISEIRYEYYDECEKRQSANGSDTTTGKGSEADGSSDKFPEGISIILRLWDQLNHRRSGKDSADSRGDWYYDTNSDGGKYRVSRSAPGRGNYPPRHAPYYPPPGGSYRSRDGYGRGPSPTRDYRDRKDRDDYFRERRYDDRRPPPPPLSPGPDMRRRPRDDRMPPPGPGARYDDRRRDGYMRPDDRFPGRGPPPRGPPSPEREQRQQVGPVHPNLSGRPSRSTYEAPPMPALQQVAHAPEIPVESNYGYANPDAGSAYGSGYYGQYQNQSISHTYGSQQTIYPTYQGQGVQAQQQQWPQQYMPPLPLKSFASRDYGRHLALPLPTDFMAGASDAPRLSMPEPHQQLGVIKGVIIRDAQGNIGLSNYTFNPL
ncbi:unnamed protein product [Umbelopsis ramanniana]